MKFFIRLFFKTLRIVLGPVMLLKEAITRPKGVVRSQAAQAVVDQQCKLLVLYHYKTCPFCAKVRQETARLSLNIERIDAQPEGRDRQALIEQGGFAKVPCLKITDGAGQSQTSEWLYESDKIIAYLRGRFQGA
jgi:glutaredoxin